MITVLFMSVTMMPLFFPNTMELNKLAQVIVAVCLFAGAYMAETVRGGLQGITRGQYDAAKSLGLGYWPTMLFVILPQALRAMIPNIVTSFISLFKDTTLVYIVLLLDLLRAARVSTLQPEFLAQGLDVVVYPFAAVYFWVGSYVMSRESRRLEKKLGVGVR